MLTTHSETIARKYLTAFPRMSDDEIAKAIGGRAVHGDVARVRRGMRG